MMILLLNKCIDFPIIHSSHVLDSRLDIFFKFYIESDLSTMDWACDYFENKLV